MRGVIIDNITVALILSAIPMVCIAAIAGIAGLVQSITQVQEQSITHCVRLLAFSVIVALLGSWSGAQIGDLFERSIRIIAAIR